MTEGGTLISDSSPSSDDCYLFAFIYSIFWDIVKTLFKFTIYPSSWTISRPCWGFSITSFVFFWVFFFGFSACSTLGTNSLITGWGGVYLRRIFVSTDGLFDWCFSSYFFVIITGTIDFGLSNRLSVV